MTTQNPTRQIGRDDGPGQQGDRSMGSATTHDWDDSDDTQKVRETKPSLISLLAIWSAPGATAVAIGTLLSVHAAGNALGPLAAGVIVDAASYDVLWVGCSAVMAIAVAISLIARAAPSTDAVAAPVPVPVAPVG